jgi:hypothetical protein
MIKMIRKMMVEEWRKNSSLYRGRSFAAFPVLVFLFSFGWSFSSINFSLISVEMLEQALKALSVFLGLGVGSIGFSGRDTLRNTLGESNYLIYSSHTLPVSRRKLFAAFLAKDLIFYLGLMVLPLSLGLLAVTGAGSLVAAGTAVGLFVVSVFAGTILTLSSLSVPVYRTLSYSRLKKINPLSAKSILDVSRSSGGLAKILFSMGVLSFFYWTLVIYYPLAYIFLTNPLVSYGLMLGLLSLSIYNWLNRFDNIEEYLYLPVNSERLLESKETAYLLVAIPFSAGLVLVSSVFYDGALLLALASTVSMTVYNLGVARRLTGLSPNRKLFETETFIKYVTLIGLFLVPLLFLSIYRLENVLRPILALEAVAFGAGIYHYVKYIEER